MKNILALILSLVTTQIFAQCISTFPYTENFEKFRKTSTTASCDATQAGDTANRWVQDPNDNGEWRADTSGTPSIGTGPGATDTTSGNGSGKDYNPGTLNGIYMYTEGTSTTSCANAVVNLLSPCFDFSATGKFYKLTFAYHMFGAGMGTLFVDIYDNGVWTNVWGLAGNRGEKWQVANVELGKYKGSNIQLRFRSVMGANFLTDMAIDDIKISEYYPSDYDAELIGSQRYVNEYTYFTSRQSQTYELNSTVRNNGYKEITGVKVIATCGSYQDTLVLDTIAPFSFKMARFPKKLNPVDTATQRVIHFETYLNQNDTIKNQSNDIGSGLTDSTFARDPGVNTGGIGFNGGVGEIGQMFYLKNKDTLSSVTFYLASPTAGDSVRVHLYTFGTAPGSLISSTPSVALRAGGNAYNLRFPCEQFLDTGKYFISVEQRNTNNMSLGYTTNFYTPQTVFFGNAAGWTESGASNFFIALLLRMEFGKIILPEVKFNVTKDSICQGESLLIRASGASSYAWLPSNSVPNPNSFQNLVSPNATYTYQVRGTNSCGLSKTNSFTLKVKESPSYTVTPDTTICANKPIVLSAKGGNSYQWIGGPANTSWSVNPPTGTTYSVKIDSTNGCSRTVNVKVDVDHAVVQVNNDTTICESSALTLKASGLASYKWLSGPATPDYTVYPTFSRSYIITGKNARGCDAMDSVRVTVIPGPTISLTNDTAVCFGNRITLVAGGGVAYQWHGGPTTTEWNFLPFSDGYRFVTVTAPNNCSKTDSVWVKVAAFPILNAGNDTTICEGGQVLLNARSNENVAYSWQHGPNTASSNEKPKSSITYKVKATNTSGCFTEDSLRATVNPLPKASFTWVQNGKQITLSNKSQHHDNLIWKLGDGNSASAEGFVHTYSADGNYTITLIASNDCGNDTMKLDIVVNTASAPSAEEAGFLFYPQPVHHVLHIQKPDFVRSEHKMFLYDVRGMAVMEWNAGTDNPTVVNLNSLASGVYFLHIHTDRGSFVQKVIRE